MNTHTQQSDQLRRFVFDHLDARGCIVNLRDTCEAIQATHHYPASLAGLLNQFAVAVCLLRDSIKIQGSVTIQLRAPGTLSLVMADCMSDRRVRAIAEYDAEVFPAGSTVDFNRLGKDAVLAITITPDEGERYQGIVPIEHASLEECLEDYFARSEQLPTWFRLLADEDQAVGIALHALPADKVTDADASAQHFERLKMLLKTLEAEEALALDAEQILTRLFHEESCRMFEARQMAFGCHCSAEKSLDAVRSLGEDDIKALIAEHQAEGKDALIVDCHFCFQRYEYEFSEIMA
ncbi:MAG: Hsp33 family molecular chaperone HslO [Pseudomonadota bacterium]